MLAIFFITIAAISEAIMDKIQFHYNKSIFKDLKNQNFWNPNVSWRNKWKNGNAKEGERFIFSSTLLVGTTDAWHLFKTIRTFCIFLALFFIPLFYSDLKIIFMLFVLSRIVFGLVFTLFYNKIFQK